MIIWSKHVCKIQIPAHSLTKYYIIFSLSIINISVQEFVHMQSACQAPRFLVNIKFHLQVLDLLKLQLYNLHQNQHIW